jgi:hypothetical protein
MPVLTMTFTDRMWAGYVAAVGWLEATAEAIEEELKAEEGKEGIDAGRLCFLADRVTFLDVETLRCQAIADALGRMRA